MGDDSYWVSATSQFQEPGALAIKVGQVVRQANAAYVNGRNVQAVAQSQAAAADVQFEQMIVTIERFVLVAAINGMIKFGWDNIRSGYLPGGCDGRRE